MKKFLIVTVVLAYLILAKVAALEIYFKIEEHLRTENEPFKKQKAYTVSPSILEELSFPAIGESKHFLAVKFEYELLKHRFKCPDKLKNSVDVFSMCTKHLGFSKGQDLCTSNRLETESAQKIIETLGNYTIHLDQKSDRIICFEAQSSTSLAAKAPTRAEHVSVEERNSAQPNLSLEADYLDLKVPPLLPCKLWDIT